MKNIHLISTDKASRFSFRKDYKYYRFRKDEFINNDTYQNQNIYITSDEDIEEGDWIYYTSALGFCKTTISSKGLEQEGIPAKKIILTTDPDLIKEGVQAIDDDFLEWFVKNPTYEYVEIKQPFTPSSMVYGINTNPYEIIIPQEEPNYNMKQEILEEMERLEKISEEETLEEAAKEYMKGWGGITNSENSFIKGAKWQAERMHNQDVIEEVRLAIKQGLTINQYLDLLINKYKTK